MLTILFTITLCAIVLLTLVGSLKLKTWDSRAHLINADGLDAPERFKLISRWGAQF